MGYRLCFASAHFDKKKNKCVVEIQGGLNIMRFFNKFGINETIFWKAIKSIKNNENNDEDYDNQDSKEIEVEIKNSFTIKMIINYDEYCSGADREEHKELSIRTLIFINKSDMKKFAFLWVKDRKQKNNWQFHSYEELLSITSKL